MHAMHDGHAHGHDPGEELVPRPGAGWKLGFALAITGVFLIVELFGAMVTGSLALLADAGHMLTDVAALSLALVAAWIARQPHSAARSYGAMRAEILAALANGVGLLVIAGYVCMEAFQRFSDPPEVAGGPMIAVAALGLAANLLAARILMSGPSHDLNLRAALVHVASDAAGSVAALAAAAAMLLFGWYLADPVAGVLMAALLVATSLRLVWLATHILLEGTPRGLDLHDLERSILRQPGVLQVHDLHAWTLTSNYHAVSAHVLVPADLPSKEREALLDSLRHMIPERYNVRHVTLQLEESAECCEETHMPGVIAAHIGAGAGRRRHHHEERS